MTEQTDQLRRLIDSRLLTGSADCVHNFFNDLISACQSQGVGFDFTAALEYWWHLARIGVVAVPGGELGALPMSGRARRIALTDRGRRLLERGEESPHDPQKYLEALKRQVGNPDAIVLTYLNEAVGAWSGGLYRSSAVMLGCACERLVLMLAEAVANTNSPQAEKVKKSLARAPVKISALFDMIRNALLATDGKTTLPGKLRDALDRKLSAIFDHARGLRNESGHPTGIEVTSQDAEAGLLLFPGFCALIHDLINHLSNATVDDG